MQDLSQTGHYLPKNTKVEPGKMTVEGDKVDRMVKHVAQSEKKLGHSKKEAENIAWATANKRGMLNNKNKK
jgi:ribosomal protein S1